MLACRLDTEHEAVAEAPRPTVAVVDDDEAVRLALCLLISALGWNAAAYASGQAFLDALPAHRPDCLLLDLNMPGMSGAEVQEALQTRAIEVPVIIITAHAGAALIGRARAAGARELLIKPFDDVDLKAAVERFVGN